ncbi:vitamin B12-dependent ribonucleotide reductase [candidate division KSB1 bacterium]|nr:vitamin B12-dependent ribonucleotide reductase [candidate division KSB1 bacterium]
MRKINDDSNGKMEGLKIAAFFNKDAVHPFHKIQWKNRNASIINDKGEPVFEQNDVEFPDNWSQTAVNVVSSKYFHGKIGSAEREHSLKQLIDRVTRTISDWGFKDGYFASHDTKEIYYHELTHLLLHQMAAFNSPVWFNLGIEKKPQISACFINSVSDSMESILTLAKTEGMLFKWGSGAGTNFSPLRSSFEKLKSGGSSSGPVSFMKGYDSFAGAIKSGGKTRRAAKMVILNIDHPDILEFINCKAEEEKKAWALIDAGYDGSFNGIAYNSVFFQNANHSVRVTDDFMKRVLNHAHWETYAVTTGEVIHTYKADELMDQIVSAAHLCGDPGLQFDTTINSWHTCPNSAWINASNPCSEYMFIDDTACNLASLNLMRFYTVENGFDIESFSNAVRIMIIAQDILIHNASYPTASIDKNSHLFRTLGLGYANLGALLMANGYPYDSDQGRSFAAAVTAIMTGMAYNTSAEIAHHLKPFPEYKKNSKPMLRVIKKHLDQVMKINKFDEISDLLQSADDVWSETYAAGKKYGYRNAQVSVLAPTGTIGFMMDCDTTGIEPDIALLKYKKLVGGGTIKLVNSTIPIALTKLGYTDDQIEAIKLYLDQQDTIEGAPNLLDQHLPVFDCAFKPLNGVRSIHYMGHIKMMAAVQPFISGAISKTVNMPHNSTHADVREAYIKSWEAGLKAVAIYRDGAKRTQPLSTSREPSSAEKKIPSKPYRRRLPDERKSITHKFTVAGHEGYITVGMFDDGMPGEMFIIMAKQGSIVSGLMNSFATAISMTLQYGVPLKVLIDKFSHVRFEPSGFTSNRQIPIAKSIIDYIFRWLQMKFMPDESDKEDFDVMEQELQQDEAVQQDIVKNESFEKHIFQTQSDAPTCSECGSIMVRNGTCYKCLTCGSTSGCS